MTKPQAISEEGQLDLNEQLLIAAENGHNETVETLLGKGAEVNKLGPNGVTALMLAAQNGRTDVVRTLLENGADVHQTDQNDRTILMMAARGGNIDVVETILSRGVDVNQSSPNGVTALMWAARGGNINVVETLLDNGADVNQSDSHGTTALMKAAEKGHNETVETLLESGADVNQSDSYGTTALMTAVLNDNINLVETLLERGADVNQSSLSGVTALMFAAGSLALEESAILNTIITKTIISQRNNGADWRTMSLGNIETGQASQLVFGDWREESVLNRLSRETVILLATVIENEELKTAIIENFNQRNPENPIDPEQNPKISKFTSLKQDLEQKFLKQIDPDAASSASASTTSDENREKAKSLAISAVGNILANPSQLEDFINYLRTIDRGGRLSGRSDDVGQEVIKHLIYNPVLDEAQNSVVLKSLAELIVVEKSENRTGGDLNFSERVLTAGAGSGAGASSAATPSAEVRSAESAPLDPVSRVCTIS